MDKSRELTPEARQVVDDITTKAGLTPEKETPEPQPKTPKKPLTPAAQELVDDITTKARLTPEKETPEPTEEKPKPPVTKEGVKKIIKHLEDLPKDETNQKAA